MLEIFERELSLTVQEKRSIPEVLVRLLAEEADSLLERRIERRIKESKLPDRKLLLRFKPHDSVCCVCFVNERSISDHCSVPTVPL